MEIKDSPKETPEHEIIAALNVTCCPAGGAAGQGSLRAIQCRPCVGTSQQAVSLQGSQVTPHTCRLVSSLCVRNL